MSEKSPTPQRSLNSSVNSSANVRGKVASALANGVKFGRRPKLTAHQRAEALQRLTAGETLAAVARSFNVAISTVWALK